MPNHSALLPQPSGGFSSTKLAPLKLLVFDLDGTLIDSQTDLANSVNATLAHYGRPAIDPAIIATFIGDGVTALMRRALAHTQPASQIFGTQDEALLEAANQWFIGWYRLHLLDHTYVYPDVLNSLQQIRRRWPSLPMAVLTNKPVAPSRTICDHFFPALFFRVYGGDSFATKKPHPEGLLSIIREAAVLPSETVMIGDSHVDVDVARSADARSLGCAWGLSPKSLALAKPDQIVENACEWPAALNL